MSKYYALAALLVAAVLVSGCASQSPLTGEVTGMVTADEPETPFQEQKTVLQWETVAEFSGTGTYPMTESFAPTKGSWRYIWSCDGEGTMSVFIMSVGSKVPASYEKAITCPASGSKAVEGVAGKEYYMRLHLTETMPGDTHWTIRAEQ